MILSSPDLIDAWASPQSFRTFVTLWGRGFGLLFGVMMIAELVLRVGDWWAHRRSDAPRSLTPADWPANYVLGAHNVLIGLLTKGLLLAGMEVGYHLSHWRIPVTPATLVVYFLAAEFCYYFYHRLSHEVRLFWADHSIHHSAQDFSFPVVYRAGPFADIYKFLTYTPVAMLGFDPVWLFVMIGFSGIQAFAHTTRVGRLGWFDYVFCSPSNHGVHHACNPRYIDRNYGGATVIWDHVLGTFRLPDDEPVRFGTLSPVHSVTPYGIWSAEFRNLLRDLRHAPWSLKLGVLFGRPGQTFHYDPAEARRPRA